MTRSDAPRERLYDPGAQPERTALAWQRTALSIVGGSLAAARIAYESIGLVALLDLLVALPLAGFALWVSRSDYMARAGRSRGTSISPGLAGAALVLAIVLLGLVELAALFNQ
ncbi:DUF202 domain-containing protein [Nocardioides acrostichi]|uniref:DUF202 domain-containing protein n=1 Tax=Nocardioides acrostichi TaxID=2784339 RepID=A0A930V1V4_9ACTN|nr:DUF202 domain-containing protein [Nocardioides acrostichi]MBF4161674.1 DUF202 domain-containing protein [Nocardioides acrostichi]